jgi:hypothetical protein
LEQDFSDVEDIFEDEPNDEPARVSSKRRGRKTTATNTNKSSGVRPPVEQHHPHDEDDGVYDIRPIYTEKGYDPMLPPIRERFPFLPEYEEDGSPKIELIVGRRPVDEKEDRAEDKNDLAAMNDDYDDDADDDDDENMGIAATRKRRSTPSKSTKMTSSPTNKLKNAKEATGSGEPVEYEYLVKYKGRSYLHLEYKSGADLESMNKSAKGIYRRYLKKVASGLDAEELESTEVDPSYILPEKILDEADQDIQVEFSDKELLRWEKQREKEMQDEEMEDVENGVATSNGPVLEVAKAYQGDAVEYSNAVEEKNGSLPPSLFASLECDWLESVNLTTMYLPLCYMQRTHKRTTGLTKTWTLACSNWRSFAPLYGVTVPTTRSLKVLTIHIEMDTSLSRQKSLALPICFFSAPCVLTFKRRILVFHSQSS